MKKILEYLLAAAVAVLLPSTANAQFREDAFTQNYNDAADTTAKDSTDVMFSFKDYFGGLAHKNESKIGTVMAGSAVFIGGAQIYNRQYWKLPVIYGGLGAGIGGGLIYRNQWKKTGDGDDKTVSNLFFAGAGLVYWGAIMDGTFNYRREEKHQPGKATMYAILFPGLGQVYNGEYWKVPIYYGLMLGSVHFYSVNNKNYHRYKRIYNDLAKGTGEHDARISASTALYYRNIYRRYRDYSIVAIAASYLLQVIDANVFSYMRDFDLSDNIDVAMDISPTVISNETVYAFNQYEGAFSRTGPVSPDSGRNGLGLKIGFTF